MMKKNNLFTALVVIPALAFTACTNSEEFVKEDRQKMLDFSVFANNSTRASETSATLKTDGKAFGVWGYSTYGSTVITVFDNQDVSYNGSTQKWEYSPLKFWDKLSSYEFYAYYPHQAGTSIIDGKISVLGFTVKSKIEDHVDLMIADKITRSAGAATATVDFDFNHILSNINLTFKKGTNIGTTKLTLKSVKLYGMDNKGSFAQTATTSSDGDWTLSGDNVITVSNATDLTTPVSGNVVPDTPGNVEFSDMLLIPQDTDDLKLYVEYVLGESGAEQPFIRTLDLSYNSPDRTYNLPSWGQNQKITYNFTIDADVIVFGEQAVVEWTPVTDVDVPTIE